MSIYIYIYVHPYSSWLIGNASILLLLLFDILLSNGMHATWRTLPHIHAYIPYILEIGDIEAQKKIKQRQNTYFSCYQLSRRMVCLHYDPQFQYHRCA